MDVETLIRSSEGCELKPYRDTMGKLTIGIGRNLESVGISTSEALMMLTNDIRACVGDLMAIFRNPFDEVRWAAVIDMRFNLGPGGFREFRNMIVALESGDWEKAADEALDSDWARQLPDRAERDAGMIRTGVWP